LTTLWLRLPDRIAGQGFPEIRGNLLAVLVDYARIAARATLLRHRSGYLDQDPPYDTDHLIRTCFPDIIVTGADLSKNLLELATRHGKTRSIHYNRAAAIGDQRVGIIHGLHHFLTDLRQPTEKSELRQCDRTARWLEEDLRTGDDPIELGCDLFAGEILVPFDVLDRLAPPSLLADGTAEKRVLDDQIDRLASKFKVESWFMRWRLQDLFYLRKTHFFARPAERPLILPRDKKRPRS